MKVQTNVKAGLEVNVKRKFQHQQQTSASNRCVNTSPVKVSKVLIYNHM